MHHNEVAFVADRIAFELLKRDLIAKGVAQNRLGVKPSKITRRGRPALDLAPAVSKWIASEIHAARGAWDVSSAAVRSAKISEGVALLKARIRELVPTTFGWWLEMDHDINFSVRWMWLGHPAVTRCGSCSDADVTILLALLESVNWDGEACVAMADVEQTEADLLRVVQERRRLKLTNPAEALALPPVEMPSMAAVSFEQKKAAIGPKVKPVRRETGHELEERLTRAAATDPQAEKKARRAADVARLEQSMEGYLDEKQRRPDSPAAAPSPAPIPEPPRIEDASTVEGDAPHPEAAALEIGGEWTGDPRKFNCEGERPNFFLSRQAAKCQLHKTTWIPVHSVCEVLELIRSRPMGTFRQLWGYGGTLRMKTAEDVWKMTGRPVPQNWCYRAPPHGRAVPDVPEERASKPNDPFWFRRN